MTCPAFRASVLANPVGAGLTGDQWSRARNHSQASRREVPLPAPHRRGGRVPDSKQPANPIYRRLRDSGHQVFAVNPNAEELRGIGATPQSPRSRTVSTERGRDPGGRGDRRYSPTARLRSARTESRLWAREPPTHALLITWGDEPLRQAQSELATPRH